jgi:hypothetical protein
VKLKQHLLNEIKAFSLGFVFLFLISTGFALVAGAIIYPKVFIPISALIFCWMFGRALMS